MTEMELLDAAGNALQSEDLELRRKAVDELATMGLRIEGRVIWGRTGSVH